MSLPRYLIVDWPALGLRCYSTQDLQETWLRSWIERETYLHGHVAYFTNQEPPANVHVRLPFSRHA